jgi:membrane protease YdiL (CAAX protease family)
MPMFRTAVVAGALVAYNNFRPELGPVSYVGVNSLLGFALGGIALGPLRSNTRELGLAGNRPRVVLAAGSAAVAVALPLFVLAAFDSTARFVADERAAGLDGRQIAFQALIRIPIGTALFEEFAFRGVLLGLFSRRGTLFGTVASSIAFGLWHIRPTVEAIEANTSTASAAATAAIVMAAVVITGVAGTALCWLRVRGGGIAAPWVFHAVLNSLSLVAATIAHRNAS